MKKLKLLTSILSLALLLSGCTINTTPGGSSSGGGSDPVEPEESAVVLHDKGVPSDQLGKDYDHYYDEDSRYVYEKRDGHWVNLYTIGSPSLYTKENKPNTLNKRGLLAAAVDPNDIAQLRRALVNTLYSTSYTCLMNPVFEVEQEHFDMLVMVDNGYGKFTAVVNGELSEPSMYGKIDENGNAYSYGSESYVRLEDGDTMYCLMPFPTIENILFQNFLLIDDDLGQLTSIVCDELNNVELIDGYYKTANMVIHHSAISSHYYTTATEDDITVNYKFKLDGNGEYIDEAEVYFNSEFLSNFGYNTIHYKFSNIRNTSFEHPL